MGNFFSICSSVKHREPRWSIPQVFLTLEAWSRKPSVHCPLFLLNSDRFFIDNVAETKYGTQAWDE